ncbi:MAG: hypothetical protein L0228_10065 [Planctomycetes bacterium]|nr:hypothetical protein [Planctomycetota bacterium]
MSGLGGWAKPGVGSELAVVESELLWGADQARNAALWKSGVISGTIRDDANTPTTIIRPGLLLGKISASGEYEEWDADVATGTQFFAGVLDAEMRAQDFSANNVDRVFRVLVARAPVKARKLLIQGAAFVGHVDEFLARQLMVQAGFVLDDDPQGYLSGLVPRFETVTGTSEALTTAMNGSTRFYNNAASVTVTLPAAKPGLVYDLIRAADEEFIVVSPTADNVIVGNDLSADGVTFTTAGQHIGARVRVRSVYVGATIKWIAELPTPPFGVGFTGGFAYSIQT